MICNICPRQCNIDRSIKKGFCASGETLRVARAALHMWEEPCISGRNGSGAVFFSGCNMRCIYCQNMEISRGRTGKDISTERLADIFLELMDKGADNINLVTPTHFAGSIIKAIESARNRGLTLPVIYNSLGYESVENIKKLEGYIDVYLPDCKYYDDELAEELSFAPGYHETAVNAISQMIAQTGECTFDENGMIRKGVIVRHMVLPGHTKDSISVLNSLYEKFKDSVYISIMSQYTPLVRIEDHPELNRRLTKREYKKVTDHAVSIGIVNGFTQEGDVAKESFIPSFDLEGV